MSTPKFVIVTGGYEVSWAPRFISRKGAEAWLAGDHEWEERTEVLYEGDTARTNCRECNQHAICDFFEYEDGWAGWLCADCQTLDPKQIEVEGSVVGLKDDVNALFSLLNGNVEVLDGYEAVEAFKALERAVWVLGVSLKKHAE